MQLHRVIGGAQIFLVFLAGIAMAVWIRDAQRKHRDLIANITAAM